MLWSWILILFLIAQMSWLEPSWEIQVSSGSPHPLFPQASIVNHFPILTGPAEKQFNCRVHSAGMTWSKSLFDRNLNTFVPFPTKALKQTYSPVCTLPDWEADELSWKNQPCHSVQYIGNSGRGIAQSIKCLPWKHKDLSSTPEPMF